MSAIFEGYAEDFHCFRGGQSYLLKTDRSSFRIWRFNGKEWESKEYSFPGQHPRKFLAKGRSFVTEDNYIAFFFADEALVFDFLAETFRQISYQEEVGLEVMFIKVFQTAHYFYFSFYELRLFGVANTRFISKSELQNDYLNLEADDTSVGLGWNPVPGINDIVISVDGLPMDIASANRRFSHGIIYTAIFPGVVGLQTPAQKNIVKTGKTAVAFPDPLAYVDLSRCRYHIGFSDVSVYDFSGTLVAKINISEVIHVFADVQYVYVFFSKNKVLTLKRRALSDYEYIDVENSKTVTDLCQDLDSSKIFVNGPGLPLCHECPATFFDVYPYLGFLERFSRKVYLINSKNNTKTKGMLQWVPRDFEIPDEDCIIFDLDTHLFL
jgi:hypothetical protein